MDCLCTRNYHDTIDCSGSIATYSFEKADLTKYQCSISSTGSYRLEEFQYSSVDKSIKYPIGIMQKSGFCVEQQKMSCLWESKPLIRSLDFPNNLIQHKPKVGGQYAVLVPCPQASATAFSRTWTHLVLLDTCVYNYKDSNYNLFSK